MPVNFTRKSGLRDAKLIVITTEGEITENQYFNQIRWSEKYKNPRVHIEVMERKNSNSDPKNCLKILNKFKKDYHLLKDDELWLVCDVDRWGQKKLSEVNQLCRQKGYNLAVSNPCFEAWLLLHKIKYGDYSETEKKKLRSLCQNIENELRKVLGAYNKSNPRMEDFIDDIDHAIKEARQIDVPRHQWPQSFGSKVFHLMESITHY